MVSCKDFTFQSINSYGVGRLIGDGNTALTISEATLEIPEKCDDIEIHGINKKAFYQNHVLSAITIARTIHFIGESAFEDCSNLKIVVFEEKSNLEWIGNKGFYSCVSLPTIQIPGSTNSIGHQCFTGCTSLTVFTYCGQSDVSKEGNSTDISDTCTKLKSIYVPRYFPDEINKIMGINVNRVATGCPQFMFTPTCVNSTKKKDMLPMYFFVGMNDKIAKNI